MPTTESALLLLAAMLSPAVTSSAAGREFHVAVTGRDDAPGTPQQPFRTISRGAAEAQPGDRESQGQLLHEAGSSPASMKTGDVAVVAPPRRRESGGTNASTTAVADAVGR